ncbi:MAG: protein-L-isoaspartate(D-aspartate) O-methyltransferase [Clostridia bacterium]
MERKKSLKDFFHDLDRSLFISRDLSEYARCDHPLPIGHGQTISQPSLVCSMVEALEIQPGSRILEIGTGSGYQTAFLAEYGKEVYTVERIDELASEARDRLHALGYRNIWYRTGDGSEGWPAHAPYDRIIVSAAPATVPEPLVEQLSRGGRMVIPVGRRHAQELTLIEKDMSGQINRKVLDHVVFVEFVGKYGWSGEDMT